MGSCSLWIIIMIITIIIIITVKLLTRGRPKRTTDPENMQETILNQQNTHKNKQNIENSRGPGQEESHCGLSVYSPGFSPEAC